MDTANPPSLILAFLSHNIIFLRLIPRLFAYIIAFNKLLRRLRLFVLCGEGFRDFNITKQVLSRNAAWWVTRFEFNGMK